MKMLKKLIEKYPDLEFWKHFPLKQVPSFAIYLSTESMYLFDKYQAWLLAPKKEEIIIGEKVGADYNVENKPKNLKEFLN